MSLLLQFVLEPLNQNMDFGLNYITFQFQIGLRNNLCPIHFPPSLTVFQHSPTDCSNLQNPRVVTHSSILESSKHQYSIVFFHLMYGCSFDVWRQSAQIVILVRKFNVTYLLFVNMKLWVRNHKRRSLPKSPIHTLFCKF